MRYVSTRGLAAPRDFAALLLDGLADDGGLFVPESFPDADLGGWRGLSYAEMAAQVLVRFAPEAGLAAWRRRTGRVYHAGVFGTDAVAPVSAMGDGLWLLHLSHGPTLAFKDIALQLLGVLFEEALAARGRSLTILGATSGDTGSAAEHALANRPGIRVFMLSPQGRTSPFQAAQMYSLDAPNIHNLVVRGVFDQCQDLVKAVNADADFKARYALGAVNSINWARVAAQAVYYIAGWYGIGGEQEIDICVPSGNFGNIYAGYVARRMGVPLRRLIVATNENDVLDVFFRTGAYRPRPADAVTPTDSPSMDISKASNFERFLFEMTGRDGAATRAFFTAPGGFDLAGTSLWERVRASGFISGASSRAERLAAIRELYQRRGAIVEPHTAAGIVVARRLAEPGVPILCLETALPAKFEEATREALGFVPPRPAGFEGIEDRPQRFVTIDPEPEQVKAAIAAAAP